MEFFVFDSLHKITGLLSYLQLREDGAYLPNNQTKSKALIQHRDIGGIDSLGINNFVGITMP